LRIAPLLPQARIMRIKHSAAASGIGSSASK